MLTIRLSRIGKRKKPMYRLIISEKARDTYGRALEILGSYNPFTKEIQAKDGRIKYWIDRGAGMSPSVNNLLISKNIIKGKKVKVSITRKKGKDKDAKAPKKDTEDAVKEKKKEIKEQPVKTKEDKGKNEPEKNKDEKTEKS